MYPYLEYRDGDEARKDNAFRDSSIDIHWDVGPAFSRSACCYIQENRRCVFLMNYTHVVLLNAPHE